MHHISKPQDQARMLEKALKERNINVKHQDALEVIAKVMGHKDWKTMSAAFKAAQEAAPQPLPPLAIMGPEDGDLYESFVTVDMTLSARIQVRAHSSEEAQRLLRKAGHEQYPRGFEVDEGNYRGPSDFHLGDPDAVENLSEVQYENDGDFFGRADWKDELFEYKVVMSRNNPDSSDEETRADVEVTLVVTSRENASISCEKGINDYAVHREDLTEWIEECLDEGDFREDFDKLTAQLKKKLQKE